ncbi:MAG: GGDEF domain-containing protein, partial [Bacilli bacterium]
MLDIYVQLDLMEQAEKYYSEIKNLDILEMEGLRYREYVLYTFMEYAIHTNDKDGATDVVDLFFKVTAQLDKQYGMHTIDAVYLNRAITRMLNDDFDGVLSDLGIARDYFLALGDTANIVYTYYTYANYYLEKNDKTSALDYYRKGIEIANENKFLSLELVGLRDVLLIEDVNTYYKRYFEIMNDEEYIETNKSILSSLVTISDQLTDAKLKVKSLIVEQTVTQNRQILLVMLFFALIAVCSVIFVIRLNAEIKMRRQREVELKKMHEIDYLTNAYTRESGYEKLSQLLENKTPFSIAIIDIDNFKQINDRFGHLFGDKVLQFVASRLIEGCSSNDWVMRFGGEEFVIVYEHINCEEAFVRLNSIRKQLYDVCFEDTTPISFSGGVARGNHNSIEENIAEVDALLYKAKYTGKNVILK